MFVQVYVVPCVCMGECVYFFGRMCLCVCAGVFACIKTFFLACVSVRVCVWVCVCVRV